MSLRLFVSLALALALAGVNKLIRPTDNVYYQELDAKYKTVRRFLPSLLLVACAAAGAADKTLYKCRAADGSLVPESKVKPIDKTRSQLCHDLCEQAKLMQAQLLAAQNEIAATQITGTARNGSTQTKLFITGSGRCSYCTHCSDCITCIL